MEWIKIISNICAVISWIGAFATLSIAFLTRKLYKQQQKRCKEIDEIWVVMKNLLEKERERIANNTDQSLDTPPK
jgi:hypothetical protein